MSSHASRSSRHALLISATVALLIGGLARTAAAKTCTTNLDCDTGYQCVTPAYASAGGATSVGSGAATGSDVGAGGAGGSVASGSGAVGSSCSKGSNCVDVPPPPTQPAMPVDGGFVFTPDAGVLPPEIVPTPIAGTCEIPCTTAADCPSADFNCVMDSMPTVAPACPANTMCPDVPASTTGICQAKAHACSTATDCPAPLTCQALAGTCTGSAAVGPDGKVITTSETCTPGPSVCSWNPVTCTIDTGCADPLYQCVAIPESGGCASSGAACAAGETCPPVPQQPACVTTPIMNCVPKLVDCACSPCPAGAACGPCQTCLPGWSCFDFSNVGGVPPAWGSIASEKACLPDGILLVWQGHAAVNGQLVAGSGSSSSSSSGGTPTLDVGGAGGASGNDGRSTGGAAQNPPTVSPAPTAEGTAGASGSPQPMAHSIGCAYGGSEAGSSWLALAMIGLVARLARRRREDR
jgi:MYXO-CTERM domain-containing protein